MSFFAEPTPASALYPSFHPDDRAHIVTHVIRKHPGREDSVAKTIALLSEISHPNVISLEVLRELEREWVVLTREALGGDVLKWVATNGPMNEELARRVIYDVLKGLSHLHSLGVWHRDVNPSNIFLMTNSGSDLVAAIGNLRFARRFERGDFSTENVGDSWYQAPEVRNGRPCIFIVLIDRQRIRGHLGTGGDTVLHAIRRGALGSGGF
jgi:serine/threonine protein kinase